MSRGVLASRANKSDKQSDPEFGEGKGLRRYVRYLPILFLVSVLIVAVYGAFIATHTFTFPSTTAAIVNKSYAIGFVANEPTPVLTTCGAVSPSSCFTSASTTRTNVTASSTLTGGSGVTLTLIYVIPLTSACSPSQPSSTTGLTVIPLPGQPPAMVSFAGSTEYDYCIYYTSASSIVAGILSINYSG